MTEIFVVTSGEYSDYSINAVFSTKEKAEKYVVATTDEYSHYNIETYKIDECEGAIRRTVFRTEMPGGRSWTYSRIDVPSRRVPHDHIVEGFNKFYADSFVSEEHSRKLAVEEYQRRLREKA